MKALGATSDMIASPIIDLPGCPPDPMFGDVPVGRALGRMGQTNHEQTRQPVFGSGRRALGRGLPSARARRRGQEVPGGFFCSPGRSCYTRQGITKMLERHLERARASNPGTWFPEGIHPHMLRASKAIHLLDAGANLIAIRDFLDHASIATTQKYLRVNSRAKMEMVMAVAPKIEVPAPSDWKSDSDLMEFLNRICS